MLRIDAAEITVFADALASGSAGMQAALQQANQAIVAEGVGIAQGLAPRDDGVLADSIQPMGGVTAEGGEFGTSLIYAWMREEGGTIYGNPWLVFPGRHGGLVRVRQVTQSGTQYMRRTVAQLEPFAMVAWGKAIERVWDGV